ncbi:MAG: lipopolysaccharide core heptose(II) kinase RfaY [Eubacterium sp.]|nr:lipopolysaccharide core heptose(II) kinase RfaY [Eubacterium sp.]
MQRPQSKGESSGGRGSNRHRLREIMVILAKNDVTRGITPEKIRKIIEELGPTFVKLGQVLSMRQDILPAAYCAELRKLQTEVSPMDFSEVVQVVETEYGQPLGEVFAHFDAAPLGSASIAQVHRAVLMDGREVVVKIQRPGIRETMARDIALLDRAATLLKLAGGTGNAVDFRMIFDEMWFTAQQEMDFLIEAHNADEFREHNLDIAYVTCPKIDHKHTTARVLVMEYIDGIEIADTHTLKAQGYDLEEIAEKLAENYIKQVVDDGFFHADPHPGNIRIQDGKIAWIDLGMMGVLSNRDKDLFRQAVEAIATRDIEEMKSVLLALGVHSAKINHARLYADVDDLFANYGTMDLSEMNIGEMMEALLNLANTHQISMPKGVTMLSRGVITIESVLTRLSPSTNIIRIMANHMKTERLENLDPEAMLKALGKEAYQAGKSTLGIPGQLFDLLKMTVKGQTKVNLELTGSEEPLATIDQMINKLVTCIITAALLIGSSFISTTDMTPKVLGIPALGVLGYLVALFLSGTLIYSIHSGKKHRYKK